VNSLQQFAHFGFYKHGTIDLTLKVDPPDAEDVYLLIGNSEAYYTLIHVYSRFSSGSCQTILDTSNFKWKPRIENGTLHLSHKETVVDSDSLLYFLVAHCGGGRVKIELDYTFLNPHNEHLSSEYAWLPTVYAGLLILWASALSVWFFNWLWFSRFRLYLHMAISIFPIVKLAWVAYNVFYYKTMSSVGSENMWTTYFVVFYALMFSSQTYLFLLLMLISKGWYIIRTQLYDPEKKTIAVTALALSASILAYHLLDDGYYLIALIVMYVVCIKFIFANLATTLGALQSQYSVLVSESAVDPDNNPVNSKFKLLQNFQGICVAFVFLNGMTVVVIIFLLENMPWVETMIKETLELLLFVGIGYLFRLRNFQVHSPRDASDESSEDFTFTETEMRNIFAVDKSKANSSLPAVFIVQNPPSKVHAGQLQIAVAHAPFHADDSEQREVVDV